MIPLPPPLSHLLEYYLITTQSYTKLSLPFAGAIAVALASAAVCCGRICRCFPSSSSKRRKKKQRHHPPISPPLFRILNTNNTRPNFWYTYTITWCVWLVSIQEKVQGIRATCCWTCAIFLLFFLYSSFV